MIIIDNNYILNGKTYKRTYSNMDLMIRKIGTDEVYTEAIDLLTSTYTYEETDIPIEPVDDEV